MKTLLLTALLVVAGCDLGPKADSITCQQGYGTCYVVHCQGRALTECQSHFKKFCSKGFEDKQYGNPNPRNGAYDRLVQCK